MTTENKPGMVTVACAAIAFFAVCATAVCLVAWIASQP